MKLLDVATVERDVQLRDFFQMSARECGVEIRLNEFCDLTPETLAMIGNGTSEPGEFRAASFPIEGFLRRGTLCAQPEDQDWFGRAFANKLDFALTWALTVEHAAGTGTWTNATGVQQTALAGTLDTQLRDAVPVARRQWMKSVLTDDPKGPIMHVPPKYAAALVTTGILQASADGSIQTNVYGDRVVVGDGYDEHPNIFFSGPITIKLGKAQQEKVTRAQINNETNVIDQGAAILVSPCSIVRVGAYV